MFVNTKQCSFGWSSPRALDLTLSWDEKIFLHGDNAVILQFLAKAIDSNSDSLCEVPFCYQQANYRSTGPIQKAILLNYGWHISIAMFVNTKP